MLYEEEEIIMRSRPSRAGSGNHHQRVASRKDEAELPGQVDGANRVETDLTAPVK